MKQSKKSSTRWDYLILQHSISQMFIFLNFIEDLDSNLYVDCLASVWTMPWLHHVSCRKTCYTCNWILDIPWERHNTIYIVCYWTFPKQDTLSMQLITGHSQCKTHCLCSLLVDSQWARHNAIHVAYFFEQDTLSISLLLDIPWARHIMHVAYYWTLPKQDTLSM